MSSEQTAKVRLFIISDTHGLRPNQGTVFQNPLPKCDILIHAGDLSDTGKLSEYEQTLSWIKTFDAKLKLIIPGNHDITLDPEFYQRRCSSFHDADEFVSTDAAHDLWTNSAARGAGIILLKETTYTFTLSGGVEFKVHASPYQPEFHDWAFNYPPKADRYNPKPTSPMETGVIGVTPIPEGIDLLITHGPPKGINDTAECTGEPAGCQWLLNALERVKPRAHFFGHIHEGFGATRVQWGINGESKETSLVPPSLDVLNSRAAHENACASWEIDVSRDGSHPLGKKGEETLCVNASLLDYGANYRCGGVLVDMELPVRRES